MTQGVEFGYGTSSTFFQCLVLSTTYLFNVLQGIDIIMPTTIVDAMNNENSTDYIVGITEEQRSWIGSLVYLSPPLGSLILSLVLERFGHRKCMAMTNMVQISAVLVVALLPTVVGTLYVCSILMGLATGLATGLSISYSGEVCEPRLRSTLTSALNVFYFGGYFLVTSMYAYNKSWKLTLFITGFVPTVNLIILTMTPDSPMWLLSKGRTEDARKVLRKIRGFVSEEKCANEFNEMVQYVSQSIKSEKAKQEEPFFSHPGMWKPLQMMLIYIFFSNILSGVPYAPNLTAIVGNFHSPMNDKWATAWYTWFSLIGNTFTVLLVNLLGKRRLLLTTVVVCSLSYLYIGTAGHFCDDTEFNNYTKLVLFFTTSFTSSLGVMPIGWILMSEVFPMKSKNMGCSIGSAFYFFLSFAMTKYYKDFEKLVLFYNTFLVFGGLGLVGFVYFYVYLPDTDNKTLQEITEGYKLEKERRHNKKNPT